MKCTVNLFPNIKGLVCSFCLMISSVPSLDLTTERPVWWMYGQWVWLLLLSPAALCQAADPGKQSSRTGMNDVCVFLSSGPLKLVDTGSKLRSLVHDADSKSFWSMFCCCSGCSGLSKPVQADPSLFERVLQAWSSWKHLKVLVAVALINIRALLKAAGGGGCLRIKHSASCLLHVLSIQGCVLMIRSAYRAHGCFPCRVDQRNLLSDWCIHQPSWIQCIPSASLCFKELGWVIFHQDITRETVLHSPACLIHWDEGRGDAGDFAENFASTFIRGPGLVRG